jgi:hypothetical protein
MGKDPAFLFYPGDWLSGTMHMQRISRACYFDLLILQFNHGPLSLDDIRACLGVDFDQWEKIKDKFIEEKSMFYNKRLKEEKEKRRAFTDSRRAGAYALHKHMLMENENENRNEVEVVKNKHKKTTQVADDQTTTQIDALYAAYPKHVGRGQAIRAIRAALKKAPYETILAGVQRYVAERAGQDAQYTANPATWFNGERWTDVDPRAIKRENEKKLQDKRDRRAAELLDREIMEARAQKKI